MTDTISDPVKEFLSKIGKKGGSVRGSARKKASCRQNAINRWNAVKRAKRLIEGGGK